jgi:hypothetical protein
MNSRYVAISKLKRNVPYRIEKIHAVRGRITLYMRGYNYHWQVEFILLYPEKAEDFRLVREFNRK